MTDSIAFGGLAYRRQGRRYVPRTVDELFGVSLAHVWDSYSTGGGPGSAVWVDRVGGLNATPQTNAPSLATRNGRNYPVFDGIDTGMAAADATTLDDASNWCIFGAFKTNAGYSFGAIIDHGGQFYVEMSFAGGVMLVDDQIATGSLTGTTLVNDNQWHRFVVTVTNNAAQLYVDGVLNASTTFATLPAVANAFLLGVQPNGTVTDSGVLLVGVATRGVTTAEAGQLDIILRNLIGT